MSLILFKKINNIISYLIILDGQKNETDNLVNILDVKNDKKCDKTQIKRLKNI